MTAVRLAWGSCLVTFALIVWAAVYGSVADSPGDADSGGSGALIASLAFVTAFATVGALVASRHPGNAIGWIMCVAGLAYALGGVAITYAESLDPGDASPGALGTFALWLSGWVWMVGIGPVVTLLLLLFPDGRLPSPRWRIVAVAAIGGLGLMIAGIAFTPGRFEDFAVENPVGVAGAETLAGLGGFLLAAAAVGSIASLVFRYRRARHEERQQLKWLTYGAAMVIMVLACTLLLETLADSDVTELSNTVVTASIAAVPVAIGIAILRTGLYDIDVVIRRTLVYAGLTATLLVAYLSGVLLLQVALSPLTEESDLAIAGSTLAVAALFRPVRGRVQDLVDRRFYRSRFDAAQTLEGFGSRLRDEVDLDALGGELRGVVSETMRPAHVSLWLRGARG